MTRLSDILAAREARARAKERLARDSGRAVICVTLRACSEARALPEFEAFFSAACARITAYFEREGARLTRAITNGACVISADGPYAFFLTDAARRAKALAMRFEAEDAGGALIDIDVADARGAPLAREDIGGAPRACIVCGRDNARECIISRAHTRAETLRATQCALARAMRIYNAPG